MITSHLFRALAFVSGLTAAASDPAGDAPTARRQEVENGLFGEVRVEGHTWSIAERMRHYRVPGLTIAVIRDFELDWAAGYGVRDARTGTPVTTHTLFQAASISKPVSAVGAMTLVEAGELSLEDDIRDSLLSWQLRENELALEHGLTLEQLLCHRGGTTVHGFGGYNRFEPVPTVSQILDGAPPANSAAVFMDIPPGRQTRYSGGGSTIVQCAMIDASEQEFADFMRRAVLEPLGMKDSTYEQPLPTERDHASGHMDDGVRVAGGFHVYPERFAAGLWTTPTDLALLFIEMQLSWRGDANRVLSQEMTQRMLTPVDRGPFGIGFSLERPLPEEVYFGHNGSNHGFKCFALVHLEAGYGAVVMTNGDGGPRAANEMLNAVKHVYEWAGFEARAIEPGESSPDELAACAGRYSMGNGSLLLVQARAGGLLVRSLPEPAFELVAVSATEFVDPARGDTYAFDGDGVRVDYGGGSLAGSRMPTDSVPGVGELACTDRIAEACALVRELHAADAQDATVSAESLNRLSTALTLGGELEAARVLAELTVELHPASAQAWGNLAGALELLERRDEAAETYLRLREILDAEGENGSFRRRHVDAWLQEQGGG